MIDNANFMFAGKDSNCFHQIQDKKSGTCQATGPTPTPANVSADLFQFDSYSTRNALTGSSRAARHAGTALAAIPTTARTRAAMARLALSTGDNPNTMLEVAFISAIAPGMPTITPA